MAVSKRLRFEILRRDNHACRYCGATAPDAKLTIDHVTPVALGGTDDPTNLVTACAECNSGKSATPADADVVADVAEDAIRWAKAMKMAAESKARQLETERSVFTHFEENVWGSWTYGYADKTFPLPANWRSSIRAFMVAGLTMSLLEECVDIACERDGISPDARFKYMCGVAWRKVGEIQNIAKDLLLAEEVE